MLAQPRTALSSGVQYLTRWAPLGNLPPSARSPSKFSAHFVGAFMKRFVLLAAMAGLAATAPAVAQEQPRTATSGYIQLAQGASSCSGWKAICESRGPGCDAKFAQCMKSGCWTEGPKYGGATHCSLAKK
jgi:hypothetical protein